MRRLSILILVMISAQVGLGQTLSRSETISYIGARLAESQDLVIHFNNETTYNISNAKCWENPKYPGKVCFSYDRVFSTGSKDFLEYIFDPTHIVSTSPISNSFDDACGLISVNLVGETLILKQYTAGVPKPLYGNSFVFPYLSAEKLNVERVQKAFLHLKKIFTEQKPRDPFLN